MTHVQHVHLVERVDLALPLDRYRDAFPARRGGFVLDGGEFALLGGEPFLAFRAYRSEHRRASGALGARVVIEDHGVTPSSLIFSTLGSLRAGRSGTLGADVEDPLDVLRALMREHAVDPSIFSRRPLPLLAGAVGYIGYETGQMLERLPCVARDHIGMPDIAFFFHDWVLGTSRATGETWLSVIGRASTSSCARKEAERTRDRISAVLASFEQGTRFLPTARSFSPPSGSDRPHAPVSVTPTTPRDAYLAKVGVAKDHILAGDAFEICLTHRLDAPFVADPFELWRDLRRVSPAPFAAFLDLPEGAIVSSSPERFLSLDASRNVESRPIKGTRPRGKTPAEDALLASELETSAKDRAENAMIVDLVRNDLGRVCRYGSVVTPEVFAIESYATVHQLVSTVRGELDETCDAIDLVRACFPPGSMTGAPKIEAMSILEELEPTERGVYSGALGWLDFSGPLDLSVVIRTIIVKDGRAHLHVGGAIVADSDDVSEHDETMHKARALLHAIGERAAVERAS
jgi:aminodeoxychorismate synthase component I